MRYSWGCPGRVQPQLLTAPGVPALEHHSTGITLSSPLMSTPLRQALCWSRTCKGEGWPPGAHPARRGQLYGAGGKGWSQVP